MSIHLYYKQPLIQTLLELTESGWYIRASVYTNFKARYTHQLLKQMTNTCVKQR